MQGILEHGQPQVIPRCQKADEPIGLIAQIIDQDGRQVVDANSPPREFRPVSPLGEIRLAAIKRRSFKNRLLEREVFEGVQRVVMNENLNRRLRGRRCAAS